MNHSHNNDRGEEVLHSHIGTQSQGHTFLIPEDHQRDHDNGKSSGRSRDHAGSSPKNRRDQADHKGGVQSDNRRYPGNDGKGDGLGDQRQGNCQTGEKIILGMDAIAEFSID